MNPTNTYSEAELLKRFLMMTGMPEADILIEEKSVNTRENALFTKEFLEKEKIYSVQVKSFVDNNITLASESLTNTLFVKTNPFYSYSLGNFETIEEARSFRYQLVKMGFEDAFVASYQNGKRIKIEDPY